LYTLKSIHVSTCWAWDLDCFYTCPQFVVSKFYLYSIIITNEPLLMMLIQSMLLSSPTRHLAVKWALGWSLPPHCVDVVLGSSLAPQLHLKETIKCPNPQLVPGAKTRLSSTTCCQQPA